MEKEIQMTKLTKKEMKQVKGGVASRQLSIGTVSTA